MDHILTSAQLPNSRSFQTRLPGFGSVSFPALLVPEHEVQRLLHPDLSHLRRTRLQLQQHALQAQQLHRALIQRALRHMRTSERARQRARGRTANASAPALEHLLADVLAERAVFLV